VSASATDGAGKAGKIGALAALHRGLKALFLYYDFNMSTALASP
jgi:hypothetical protein